MVQNVIDSVAPVRGTWVDCTFGAGGYSRALIRAGAEHVFGIDCDANSLALTSEKDAVWSDRLTLLNSWFGDFDQLPDIASAVPLDGVVFDLGVSSMQIGEPHRGFSFLQDGPLDMRMSSSGRSAADIINSWSETELADTFYSFGEERAARRIARRIVQERREKPITTTSQLSEIIRNCAVKSDSRKIHPATKCFQALRIAVNDELSQLARGLQAAERALRVGGKLAVVTFHSLEDRIVKRFLRIRGGNPPAANRHSPPVQAPDGGFVLAFRKAITPEAEEVMRNPRARSGKLRIAVRTEAPACEVDHRQLGVPEIRLIGARK